MEFAFPREVCVTGGAVGMGPSKWRGTRKSVITAPRQEQRFGNGHFRGQLLQKGFLSEERPHSP